MKLMTATTTLELIWWKRGLLSRLILLMSSLFSLNECLQQSIHHESSNLKSKNNNETRWSHLNMFSKYSEAEARTTL